ncbi:MAG: fatty acid desaturase family protein [Bryobacteraceae bacterium]
MSAVTLSYPLRSEALSELDEAHIRDLVRDLHRVQARRYWFDLSITVIVGWGAFAWAAAMPLFSARMFVGGAIAVLALYRALCFLHELSHQSRRTLPGLETVWNCIVGYALLMPSFMYVGVHPNHHKLSTYGTAEDPEYLPFARSRRMTIFFALESFFIPAFLVARFLILTPAGLVWKRGQELLAIYASSLTMHTRYRREAPPALIGKIRRHSAAILCLWAAAIGAAAIGLLPWRIFIVWLLVCSFICFLNTTRTLGAHSYESSGAPLDRMGQLLDSIDTPGGFWTELWAPVGLRYHALHHYFPGIPYHNLAAAYRRITACVQVSAGYSQVTSPSLQRSLRVLYEKGARGGRV